VEKKGRTRKEFGKAPRSLMTVWPRLLLALKGYASNRSVRKGRKHCGEGGLLLVKFLYATDLKDARHSGGRDLRGDSGIGSRKTTTEKSLHSKTTKEGKRSSHRRTAIEGIVQIKPKGGGGTPPQNHPQLGPNPGKVRKDRGSILALAARQMGKGRSKNDLVSE